MKPKNFPARRAAKQGKSKAEIAIARMIRTKKDRTDHALLVRK